MTIVNDTLAAKRALSTLPTEWDGRKCILELKAADYNWRQMEWWAFYFEYCCRRSLAGEFRMPGDKIGTVSFDAKRSVNWDFKATAIKTDNHRSILNDVSAMDETLRKYGSHGLIVAMCDVEYNDTSRTFQKWHENLKGGKSRYELEREQRTEMSRYRKTCATLREILFLTINSNNVNLLDLHHQGRNSNGEPRPAKYMLDFETVGRFLTDRLTFQSHVP